MRNYLILIGLVLFTFTAQAQYDLMYTVNKEGKIIVLPKLKPYEFHISPTTYYSYTPASIKNMEFKLQNFTSDYPKIPDERPMDMQILSEAYKPFFNVFSPMLHRVSPTAFDFVEASFVPITENLTFLTVGRQSTWPGAGGTTIVSPMLSWRSDNWTITGGGYAGRYFTPFNSSPGFLGGANLNVKYDVTDWMAVRAWGQYALYQGSNTDANEKFNPHMLMNPFYPHTSVGGAFEFNLNENIGLGVGVNYEFNPVRRKMEAQRLIYPVIRSGKIKIGR